MCSIAGSDSKVQTKKMLSVMKHRAPDDEGLVKNGIWMGMGRLAIIDLDSKGLCPIQFGNLTLVFNGELFNYLELRKELIKKGFSFETQSDSEVLLKAYAAWGQDCLDKFNFMGAFAISDGEHIFLARDIAGEKPLYFRRKPFCFASEAKALDFDCEELLPAHCAVYSVKNTQLQVRRWWTMPQGTKFPGGFADAVTEMDALLADSVRLRTRSDAAYGLYFSGGIDSTLISTYHNFKHKFTYEDADYSQEFKKVLPKIVWHLDYPVKSFSAFGLWKLAEQASKEVKVVLSGEGADELFGGYVRYVPNEFNRLAREKFPSYSGLFPYKDLMRKEFSGNLVELLRMNDRLTSAFGVENRCPFLDRRIIEFAASLPMEWKIKGLKTKVILRKLLEQRKPDYQDIEKAGLFCSVNHWIGADNEGFGKTSYLKLQKEVARKYNQ